MSGTDNNNRRLSCADCAVVNCIYEEGEFSAFCLTKKLDDKVLKDAIVTTLVSKDRVLAHNTVAAIYQADKYYKSKFFS